ncbi:MAG: GH36-type glycosyl hydrolase domain-containing protein [Acetatifactor sp.]
MKSICMWESDSAGLPCFCYTGDVPYREKLGNGNEVKLPEDPWFLLGNYRLTLFTHVSGEYELISGQRSWARINQGKKRNSGVNAAVILVDGREYFLAGMNSLAAKADTCKRTFGCGFANYTYDLNGITVNRNLSVKPSTTPYDGTSAFLLTVTIKNNSDRERTYTYYESVGANFETIQYQLTPKEAFPLQYINRYSVDRTTNSAKVTITTASKDPLLAVDREAMSKQDVFPPVLFMKSLSDNTVFKGDEHEIGAIFTGSLAPYEEKVIRMIIGYSFEPAFDDICEELMAGRTVSEPVCAFSEEWMNVIPAFDDEEDQVLRREMRWHAYNLEAMATYSEYYGETKIPQGTIYDYHWGQHASARDNFQHALPLVYYNPKLAKSVLKYMLKRTTPFGEIRLIEMGNGYADNDRYFTSDQQLYFFLLLSEYLRVTKDYAFLEEMVQPYPCRNQREMSVADFAEKCFIFLRDTIGTGEHGLIRLMNSDWNDAVYYIVKVPYNNVFFTGESHMNSAMALSIFGRMLPELDRAAETVSCSAKLQRLSQSIALYRQRLLDAFLRDMGERSFPRRMYFNGRAYGDDNMFLEPQGFTLQLDELSEKRKKALYGEMKKRVYDGEKLGAREQEAPEFDDDHFEPGSRENGGFWWALNGPVILGVAQFDKDEAQRLLKDMTLQHLSEEFPQYWSSYWSAADNLESSLIPEEGLPDQTIDYAAIPVYCAHPHAWILYCYYYLREM